MAKSRARSIVEKYGPATGRRVGEDATPSSDADTAGAQHLGTDQTGATGATSSDKGATPDPNQPASPEMEGFLRENGSQPDGMADVVDKCGDMMDNYMNEDDDTTFTPQDDEERGMIGEAKGHMKMAARKLREMAERRSPRAPA